MTAPLIRNLDLLVENYINQEHTLLGLRLKPFCLLHLLWLESIHSPLIVGGDFAVKDFEIAALICSSSSNEEILAKLTAKNTNLLQRTLRKFWRYRNRKKDAYALLQSFLAYQRDFYSPPEYADDKSTEVYNEKIPSLYLWAVSLIKATGWPEETVFTMGLGKLQWYNAALGFLSSGDSRVISDKEREIYAHLEGLTQGAS